MNIGFITILQNTTKKYNKPLKNIDVSLKLKKIVSTVNKLEKAEIFNIGVKISLFGGIAVDFSGDGIREFFIIFFIVEQLLFICIVLLVLSHSFAMNYYYKIRQIQSQNISNLKSK